ncbi:hypothetical protein KI387_039137, partial [Taxus chinensis]
MKFDGTVIKLSTPVNVKEIVGDQSDHGVFEADAVRLLGVLTRPLTESADLQRGRLYFLIPLPNQPGLFSRPCSDKLLTLASSIRQLRFSGRDFSDRHLTKQRFDSRVQIVPSTDDGSSLRVKFRLRKDELAKLLPIDGNYLLEDLVVPMIQQAVDNKAEDLISRPPSL